MQGTEVSMDAGSRSVQETDEYNNDFPRQT
jgi:hypothetical protein